MDQSFSIKEVLSFGWQKAKQHLWLFCLIAAVVVGVVVVGSVLMGIFGEESIVSMVVSFICQVFGFIASIVMLLVVVRLARGETMTFGQVVDLFKHVLGREPGLILAFLLVSAWVQFVVSLWSLLFIIPGIYYFLKYSQTIYLVMDKKISYDISVVGWRNRWAEVKRVVREALRMSSEMTNGAKWQLVKFGIVGGLIILIVWIPGILTLGIGFVFVWTMIQFAAVRVYMTLLNRIEQPTAAPVVSESSQPTV